MRYTQMEAFYKHLKGSAPHHLCRIYLICCSDPYERKAALDRVLSYLKGPDSLVSHFCAGDAPFGKVLDALNSPKLFGGDPLVVVDEVDKKLHDALSPWFVEPLEYGYLFMTSKTRVNHSFAEKHGVVLDLTQEKPWEREKRWITTLHEMAQNAGKKINQDAAQLLLERLDSDAALVSNEMYKLLCYSADRSVVSRADVEEVCRVSKNYSLWHVADELIWEKNFRASAADLSDSSFFYGLLAALRQQLQIGLRMSALIEAQVPLSEWKAHFPKIWPKALERKARIAQRFCAKYFRNGLNLVFEMELLAKNGQVPTEALIDSFRAKVYAGSD